MNASWPKFEGPAATALGGADISWLVGFAVAGLVYYVASRTGSAPEGAATRVDTTTDLRVPAGAHLATEVPPA
jgi:hypothetical protein